MGKHEPNRQLEIHGFCDASKRAYGAVVYAKIIHEGHIYVHLIRSKTHLFKYEKNSESETNDSTNPRKELCAAL